jgi:hypothetical protein
MVERIVKVAVTPKVEYVTIYIQGIIKKTEGNLDMKCANLRDFVLSPRTVLI